MYDQPKYETSEASSFFPDGMSARQPVVGTVARDQLWLDDPFLTGQRDGRPVQAIPTDPRAKEPFRLSRDVLERGQQRFNVVCSVCHGQTGYGDGMVVRRGFPRPPSFHQPRLRDETPPGQIFDVITNGFRTMPAQKSRVAVADRWAIVAYIRALQRSQHVELSKAPDDVRRKFP
jgi:mono/diheme cytochrome c family protein